MLGHLADNELERYRHRQMSPEELLAADDHLSSCRECFTRLSDNTRALAEMVSAGLSARAEATSEFDHLSFEHMSDYVDGRLQTPDRESVETHIAYCSRCESEIGELSSVKVLVDSNARKRYAPSSRGAIKKRMPSWWRLPAYRIPIQIAGALAAALLLFWAATLPLRSQVAELRAQLAKLQGENEDLRGKASAAVELEGKLADLKRQNEETQRDYDGATQIAVSLNDGDGRVVMDKQGNVTGIEALTSAYQRDVKGALMRGRVQVPTETRTLAGESGKLMGASDDRGGYGLVSPVGTAVQADRPTLRWRSLNGAASYVITVYAPHFKVAATSEPLVATEWTVPVSLERGHVYSWQVRAVVKGNEVVMPSPQAPEARFKVLEGAKLAELERVRNTHAKSHLLLGIVYAEMGLLDDSERELKALLDANPQSPAVQSLLRSVRTRRPAAPDRPR